MKCLYECLDDEWFKVAFGTAKELEGDNAVSYLLGMRNVIRDRVKYDMTKREERVYNYLINKEIGRKRK